MDLSALKGESVNDGISTELCSLQYAKMDQVVTIIIVLGTGALLAKLDIQSAYSIIPVHPDDHCLLGIFWQGTVFLDATLPFGLRSAPKSLVLSQMPCCGS